MVHALKPGGPTRLLLLAGRFCHLDACRPRLALKGLQILMSWQSPLLQAGEWQSSLQTCK